MRRPKQRYLPPKAVTLQPVVAMESPAVHTYVAEEPPTTEEVQPKRKGLKSLPKGVIESKGRRRRR